MIIKISSMKTLLKYLKIFAILLIIFVGFGIFACLLPSDNIRYNIRKSVQRGDLAEEYPLAVIQKENCKLDNFTDALILNEAYCMDKSNLLQSIFLLRQSVYEQSQTNTLRLLVYNNNYNLDNGYTRYWHGNTFLARCFMTVASYSHWRIFLYVLSSLLLLFTCLKLYQATSTRVAILFAVAFLSCNVFIAQISLQFFPVLCLALIGSLSVIKYHHNYTKIYEMFFIFGCLTIYFDLLTTPALTLGTMLAVWLALETTDNKVSFTKDLKKLFSFSAIWLIGSIVTWLSKWILAFLTVEKDVFKQAFNQITERSSSQFGDMDLTRFDAIKNNFQHVQWMVVLVVAIILVYFIVRHFNKYGIKAFGLFLLIALLPYVWYIIVDNHSYVHYWFTFRLQIVAVMGLLFALNSMVKPPDNKQKINP